MARVTEIYPSFADFWVQDVTPFTLPSAKPKKQSASIHQLYNNPFWKVPGPEAQYCWRSRWSLTSVTLKFSESFLQKMKSPKFQNRTMTRSDLVLKKYVSVHSFGLVQDRIGRCRWCSRGSNLCPMKRPRAWKLASKMLHRFKKRVLTFAYSKKGGRKQEVHFWHSIFHSWRWHGLLWSTFRYHRWYGLMSVALHVTSARLGCGKSHLKYGYVGHQKWSWSQLHLPTTTAICWYAIWSTCPP